MQQEPTVIEGVVTRGRQLGRRLGFPTANMEVGREVTAEAGVYASEAEVNGRCYRAMSNLGSNPTVGGRPATWKPTCSISPATSMAGRCGCGC